MKIYLIGEEIDEVLLKYIYTFHFRDELVICGKLDGITYLNCLSIFNVKFTEENLIYLSDGKVSSFSDGIILTGHGPEAVIKKLITRDLDDYRYKIQNIMTGEVYTNLSIFSSYSDYSSDDYKVVSSQDLTSLLKISKPEVIKLFTGVVPDITLEHSEELSEVYFGIDDTSIVPLNKGFVECSNSGFDFKFNIDSDTFSCFDRRFLRTTVCPISRLKVISKSVPSVNVVSEFPYNLLLDNSDTISESEETVMDNAMKDFVYDCIANSIKPVIYMIGSNEDIIEKLDYLGYPIEIVKTWRYYYE